MKNKFCHACNLQFDTKSFFIHHLSIVHGIVLEIKKESADLEENSGKSNYGDFKISEFSKGTIESRDENKKLLNFDNKPFSCKYCGKNFVNSFTLERHTQNIHEFKTKQYSCEKCDFSFAQKCNLKKHVNSVHSKIKPFKCTQCVRACISKIDLNIHISTVHEGKRPHNCNICKTNYTSVGVLNRHKITKKHLRAMGNLNPFLQLSSTPNLK